VLITPGDDEALLRKAARSEADVSVHDWEDGVFASRKAVAREISRDVLATEDWSSHEVVIRINSTDSPYFADDIEAAASLPIAGIRIAKVRNPEDVILAAGMLDKSEHGRRPVGLGPLELWASIETVEGLIAVNEIAGCHPRLSALSFGGGDLGADLGILRLELGDKRTFGPVRYEYLYGQSRVVAAARAHGLDAINMGYTSYKDVEGTRWDARFAAQLGFTGAIALSVRQLPPINEGFTPSADDLAWAESTLRAFESANTERERTVIVVRDQMADGPLIRNARRILELKRAVDAKLARRL
jgi:citrate lyase subunit beta/citryl-CoA lyase